MLKEKKNFSFCATDSGVSTYRLDFESFGPKGSKPTPQDSFSQVEARCDTADSGLLFPLHLFTSPKLFIGFFTFYNFSKGTPGKNVSSKVTPNFLAYNTQRLRKFFIENLFVVCAG